MWHVLLAAPQALLKNFLRSGDTALLKEVVPAYKLQVPT